MVDVRADAEGAKIRFVPFAKKIQTVVGVFITEELFGFDFLTVVLTCRRFLLELFNLSNLQLFELVFNRANTANVAVAYFLGIYGVHDFGLINQTGFKTFWLVHLTDCTFDADLMMAA